MPTNGHNKEIENSIAEAVQTIIGLDEERGQINAQINAERKKVKALGVPLAALNLAITHYQMDQAKRKQIDDGYALVRHALGIDVGAGLVLPASFVAGEDPAIHDAEAK